MSRTTFSGPVKSGTNRYSPSKNVGTTVLTQSTAFAFTAAGTTTNTFYIPSASKILSITFDTTTAFTGGTGAVMQLGLEAELNGDPLSIQKIDVYVAQGKTV